MNRGSTTRSRQPLTQEQRDSCNKRRRELRALQSSANQLRPPAIQTAFATTEICLPAPTDNVAQQRTPTIKSSSAREDRLRELNRARVRRSRERLRAEERDAQNARRRQRRAQAASQAQATDRACTFQTGEEDQSSLRRLLHRNNARARRHNMTPQQREVRNRQRRERRHLCEDRSRTLPNFASTHATSNHGESSTSMHTSTLAPAAVPITNDGSRTLNDNGFPCSTFHLEDSEASTRTATTLHASGTTSLIDESLNTTSQALKQNNPPLNQEPSSHKEAPTVSKMPWVSQKKLQAHVKPSICPNSLIKAAAFAAGGRIATPSTAASLFKAARSKNAVRIRHGGAAPPAGPPVTSAAAAAAMPSPASASTAPVTAVIDLVPAVNPRFPHASASKLCDVQGCVGKAPCQLRPAILRGFAGR